jgi:ubiquinone/menaquinone biosynthesis C-methylase UbiE
LGYSWGVLHHTPNTEKAVAELVRVVKPGGEVKIMLYNRRSLCAFHHWVKYALFRGRPWRSFRDVLWHHMESVGTKSYTSCELRRMLAPLGLADVRIETFVTSYDYLPWKSFPFSICNAALGVLIALTGNRLGFWHGITARKQ